MTEEEKKQIIQEAFQAFKEKITDVKKRQVALFDKIDKISSKEKADEVRNKINNL